MPYRVSFRFNLASSRLGGWTENYWNAGGTLGDVSARAVLLLPSLTGCHGSQAYCSSYRVANATGTRDSQLFNVEGSGPLPPTVLNPDCDYPTTALQISLRRAGGSGTHVWMRGLQDSVISNAGRYVPSGPFVPRFAQYVAQLTDTSAQWSLYKLDAAQPRRLIDSVSLLGVVTSPAHGFTGSNRIRIQRVANVPGVNRKWRIQVLSADTYQLLNFVPYTPLPSNFGDGYAVEQVYLTSQIQDVSIVRSTSHRVGRPLDLLSGRRKTAAT